MAGLRERKKERCRKAILDAALELLRSNDIRVVTIEQIAARAEVSPPTVYNLVGTREQLLAALVDRISEALVALFAVPDGEPEDPIAAARRAVDESVAAFVADSAAYRQIIRSLGDPAGAGSQLSLDPVRLHIRAMQGAQSQGLLRRELDPVALGRQSLLTYIAALQMWAGGALSDAGFRTAAQHGIATVLAAASSDAHRAQYQAELARLGRELAAVAWNPR